MPSSGSVAGSGVPLNVAGELTPDRNAIGGRLVVLPLSPHARKLSRSVVASAVRLTETASQFTPPPDGTDITVVAAMDAVGSKLEWTQAVPQLVSWTEGLEALAEKSPDVPSETIHWFVVAPVKPIC